MLRRIRALDPKTPIAVSYDMHANLYPAMIENATVVSGYRTYPHIDTYETALRAGEVLLKAMRGEMRPVIAWGNVPMLPHVMKQGSDDHPNKELQARCAALSGEGALIASLFTGFPHADIAQCRAQRRRGDRRRSAGSPSGCATICSTGRGSTARISSTSSNRSPSRWRGRGPCRPDGEGPVVLLDHYDNCASGGTMDTTVVLKAILDAGLDNVAAFAIYDPDAVAAGDRGRDRRRGVAVGRRQDGDAANSRPRARR